MGYSLRICHLYPDLMNLYGDRGNVMVLRQRALWRGIGVEIINVSLGDRTDLAECDIIFVGGGQDKEQSLICHDFRMVKGSSLAEAIEADAAVLAICGGYQLLGQKYLTHTGEEMPGLGVIDVWTRGGTRRLIGNVVIQSDLDGSDQTLVGFENHSGQTFLGSGVRPLGRVISGNGNNGQDRTEGAVYRNTVGTYLHGSLLPKNPWLADWLLTQALQRKYGEVELAALDDELEESAHRASLRRAGSQ